MASLLRRWIFTFLLWLLLPPAVATVGLLSGPAYCADEYAVAPDDALAEHWNRVAYESMWRKTVLHPRPDGAEGAVTAMRIEQAAHVQRAIDNATVFNRMAASDKVAASVLARRPSPCVDIAKEIVESDRVRTTASREWRFDNSGRARGEHAEMNHPIEVMAP